MALWKRNQHDGRRLVTTAPADAAVVLEAAIPKAADLPGPEEPVVLATDSDKVLMVLIEVQTGIYLGEDDVIRYDDVYARARRAEGQG